MFIKFGALIVRYYKLEIIAYWKNSYYIVAQSRTKYDGKVILYTNIQCSVREPDPLRKIYREQEPLNYFRGIQRW